VNGSICTRKTLAASDFMLVEQCSCGSVHVTIGAVTLRLATSAIPAIATTLGEAARALVLCNAFAPSTRPTEVLS
jgi:hypothetical protein